MKTIKRAISFILIFTIIIISNINCGISLVSAATITTAYVDHTNVNVRSGPSTSYASIGQISYCTVEYLSSEKNSINEIWYKINATIGGELKTGYIRSDFVTITTYNPDATFEEKIKAFPESYRDSLRSLHATYPNWEFTPDPISMSFNGAVAMQSVNMRKTVTEGQTIAWRSMGAGYYDWNKKTWMTSNGKNYGASKEVIAYYMDPRNFLDSGSIYMFLDQGYNSAIQNEAGVSKIISGTFLANNYYDPDDTAYGGSYLNVIMEAARQSGANPYIIASKIIQEQGVKGTSSLISGTTGYGKYYNFMNWSASGATEADVIANGLAFAKEQGWTTRSKSIIEGAKRLAKNYISVGQNTYYYQDFNVKNPDKLWHQYAQSIHDAYNKGRNLADEYKDQKDMSLNFHIPVFTDMPATASPKPSQGNMLNNYYFSDIQVSGLTPSFDKYINDYTLSVYGDTTINLKSVGDSSSYEGSSSYSLNSGENIISLPVRSQTGYVAYYNISVHASTPCVLYISFDGKAPEINGGFKNGDTNQDGKITLSDMSNIRLHLLGRYTLTGNALKLADTNKDGKITLSDMSNIRLHLLGKYNLG